MVIALQTPEMVLPNKAPILVFLMICISCVSGLGVPQPDELAVDILDGEAIVFWEHPVNVPPHCKYNVQMKKHNEDWAAVASCTGITETYCDLSSLIHDYRTAYKVKVQLVVGDQMSAWKLKKFLPNASKLQPPSFTLWATSSTLKVYVHQKPILKKLFPYGPAYTIYLEERGSNNKTTTAYLKDDMGEGQRTKTFSPLHWGSVYCVSIKVEGEGALSTSIVSPEQCLQLPEQEWFITAVTSLSVTGVLVLFVIAGAILQCYLRRPEKSPAALKSPISGWLPLSVEDGTIEVVTDKAWFLSSYTAEEKEPVCHVTVTEDKDEEDRRTSTDSGVSMESATNSRESPPTRQEDSGFGSLGGPESSTSSQTDYTLEEERTQGGIARRREDSGLDKQDSGSLKEAVAGGDYRSQNPSDVEIQVCDDEEAFKTTLPVLAELVMGYRAGPQSCVCSGAGQCTWCHKQGLYGGGVTKQYRAMCIDNRLLGGKCDFVDSYKDIMLSSYSKRSHMDHVMMDDSGTFMQLAETFPLLNVLTPLPLVEGGQDFDINNVSLSLCDVQLTTD